MSAIKKGNKNKLISKDFNESQFVKPSKVKRTSKWQRCDLEMEEEDISKLKGLDQESENKQVDTAAGCQELRQKLMNVMGNQFNARKDASINLLTNLKEVQTELEADCNALKKNEQKLQHLAEVVLKCVQQTSAAQNNKIETLKEIHDSFKKQCEDMEIKHKTETERLADELEEDMKKLQQKLISETKQKQYENLRRTIFHAFKNDL